MKDKLKEWLKRYLPAEISAAVVAILFASGIFFLTKNRVIAAYGGVIGDILGYYFFIVLRDTKKFKFLSLLKNIIIEFGPAEIIDNLVVRPYLMYLLPLLVKDYVLGILLAKIGADIIFYIPTIFFYELRKKYFN